jgi:hypothetical protein
MKTPCGEELHMHATESKQEGMCRDDERISRYELALTLTRLVTVVSETRPVQATVVPGEAHLTQS